MQMNRWLVIDPAADDIRVLKSEPSLRRGQAAFPLRVLIPDTQRRIFSDQPIILTMPGWSPPIVGVGPAEGIEEVDVERPIAHAFTPGGYDGMCSFKLPPNDDGDFMLCASPASRHMPD